LFLVAKEKNKEPSTQLSCVWYLFLQNVSPQTVVFRQKYY